MSNDSSSRIVSALRELVAGSSPGTRLPSSRALVSRFQASPITVQKAISTLVAEGLVETRPGSGSFVRRTSATTTADFSWQSTTLGSAPRGADLSGPLADSRLDAIGLHVGYPTADLLPTSAVRTALARASRSEHAYTSAPTAGLPQLRSWFATDLGSRLQHGVPAPSAADVVVVPGSQAALSAIFRSVAGPRSAVVVESPTYWGAIQAARQAGVDVVPVASGPHGPDPADLEQAVSDSGARAMYLQPHFSNPTGALWSRATREDALQLARERGLFVIEDDWARDFAIEDTAPPLAAYDTDGHVVYLRSVTKSLSPALRVAAVVARGPVRRRVLAESAATMMYVSPVLQAAAADVIGSAAWRTHLRPLPAHLRRRRDQVVGSLRRHLPECHIAAVPRGGLNVWMQLAAGWDSAELVSACRARDVLLADGDDWFPAEPTGEFLRFNFAAIDPTDLESGLEVVAAAARELYS